VPRNGIDGGFSSRSEALSERSRSFPVRRHTRAENE
jgi:hypothetical protein